MGKVPTTYIIIKERSFRFLLIFIDFMQLNEDENWRFIHYKVYSETFIMHIKTYFGYENIQTIFYILKYIVL